MSPARPSRRSCVPRDGDRHVAQPKQLKTPATLVVGTVPRSKNTIRSAVSCAIASGIDLQIITQTSMGLPA